MGSPDSVPLSLSASSSGNTIALTLREDTKPNRCLKQNDANLDVRRKNVDSPVRQKGAMLITMKYQRGSRAA